MGKYQRTKGHNAEREVVKYWRSLFPNAKRNWEFTTETAQEGVDVILDKNHHIQVKIGKQVPVTIYKYLEQMTSKNALKWVQCRRDGKEWLVILKADDFVPFIYQMIQIYGRNK